MLPTIEATRVADAHLPATYMRAARRARAIAPHAPHVRCWVTLVKLHIPNNANVKWNAVRHMLAAAHVEYYTLQVY